MKSQKIIEQLHKENLLSSEEHQKLAHHYNTKLFSIHWELKTILYLGVMLLSTGVGILIYLNIDTIGHTAILSLIGLACLGCFLYCFREIKPFTWQESINEHPFSDYILLLGCLLFLSFEGYLQFQYNIFGTRYGLAAIIPSTLFFFLAYRFDHKGILSMAITGLGSWLGITVTPLNMFEQDFGSTYLIYTGIGLGTVLTITSFVIITKDWKKHFSFTYFNFGIQLLFICTSSAIFTFGTIKYLFFILLTGLCYMAFAYAKKEQSFYFLLLAALYGYIGVTYLLVLFIDYLDGFSSFEVGLIYLSLLYFVLSCIGIIYFFFNYKKFLKS